MPLMMLAVVCSVALLLAGAAFLLAVVANRRHIVARRRDRRHDRVHRAMSAGHADSAPGGRAEPAAALGSAPAEKLGSRVDELAAELAALCDSAEDCRHRLAELEGRTHALPDELADVADQVDALDARLAEQAQESEELHVGQAAACDRAEAAELLADEARQQAETTRDVTSALMLQVETLTQRVTDLGEAMHARTDPTALRHVAVVRYDAFADVGGRLSYSLAALDESRSGFVITSLAGKSEMRTYVRTISGGRGDCRLTVEEQQAIEAACEGAGSRL